MAPGRAANGTRKSSNRTPAGPRTPPAENAPRHRQASARAPLFANVDKGSTVIQLDIKTALTEEQYEAASRQSRVCNLQLRVEAASRQELMLYPARLAAADAFALSPVLRARIEGLDDSSAPGIATLELAVGVSQELLSLVVHSVYSKKILVEPAMVEALLLLADHLQLDWLMKSIASYVKAELLPEHAMEVCRLASAYHGIHLFTAAATLILAGPVESSVFVDLMRLAYDEAQRTTLVRLIARNETPAWCLEHLDALRRESSVRLTPAQAQAVVAIHPELFVSLAAFSDITFEGDVDARWGQQSAFYRETCLAAEASRHVRRTLVWDLPVAQLSRSAEVESPDFLEVDRRRFKLSSTCRASKEDARRMEWGLYVETAGSTVWAAGDCFKVAAVKTQASRTLEIPREAFNTRESWGFPRLVSRWQSDPAALISDGKFLPVSLTKL